MKALNRKEALVNAKANGTLDDFKPLTREEAFTKKALELGGGDVAWEDIKNRPFGEEVETVSVECDYYNNGSTNTLDIDMPLVSGNVYQIEISKDGEVFDAVSCTAYETTIMNTSAIVLGNAELANGTGGNGESVMIAYAPSQNAYMGAIDGEVGDYHIKVTGPVARITTLDPKYLPEGVGGGLLITLDDNTGEWTANMSYDEALKAIFNGAPVVYSEKYDFETIFVYNPTVTVHDDYIEISVDAGDVEGVALKFAPDNTIGELGPM